MMYTRGIVVALFYVQVCINLQEAYKKINMDVRNGTCDMHVHVYYVWYVCLNFIISLALTVDGKL